MVCGWSWVPASFLQSLSTPAPVGFWSHCQRIATAVRAWVCFTLFHPHKGGYPAQSAILKTLMSLSLLPKASVSCEHDNFPIPYYLELLIYKLEKKTRELLCTSLFSLMSVERPVGLGQVPLKSAVPIPLPAMLPSSHLSQAFPLSLPPRACQNQRWRLLHLVTSSSVRW